MTVSLEIAKQLKEAGWKKETEYGFIELPALHNYEKNYDIWYLEMFKDYHEESSLLYAPQMHEILEELPESIKDTTGSEAILELDKFNGEYEIQYAYKFDGGCAVYTVSCKQQVVAA